jgi:hypothetical protein
MKPTNFPLIRAAYAAERKGSTVGFDAAVETVAQGVEAKSIFNVDLKDAKDTLNRAAYAANNALRAVWTNSGAWANLPADVYSAIDSVSLYDMHSSISASKKLSKAPAHPAVEAYRAVVAEGLVLAQALASLKALVVMGRKPDPKAAARKAASAPKNPMARATCGCCFATQAVLPNGLIHDHGYTLPQAWMKTASCYGQRFASLEVSVAGPVFMADLLKRYITDTKAALAAAPARKSITKTNHYKGTSVTLNKGDAGFDYELRCLIAGLESTIRAATSDLVKFEKVIAEWKPAA